MKRRLKQKAILLITGSRNHPVGRTRIEKMVRDVLIDFAARHKGKRLVLMHGACPNQDPYTSIDWVADRIGNLIGFDIERRPVDHKFDGPWPKAGPNRSGRMVQECVEEQAEGAVVECHGFPAPGSSPGTSRCLVKATNASLEVQVHRG